MFNKGTVLLQSYQCILVDFSCKAYSKVDFGCAKISDAIFFESILLLSTTVLNDLDYTHTHACVHIHMISNCTCTI